MDKRRLPRIKRSPPPNEAEIATFLKCLPPPIRLLAETYQWASAAYANMGLTYYWKELFSLPAHAVSDFKEKTAVVKEKTTIIKEKTGVIVNFYRNSTYGTMGEDFYTHYVPRKLVLKLIGLAKTNANGPLFQQESGHAFNHARLSKEFSQASKKAIGKGAIKRSISPTALRAAIPEEVEKARSGSYREVKVETVEAVRRFLASVPKSYRGAGRPSQIDLHHTLKVLLAQHECGYSRKKLTELFHSVHAAESQKRRWEKRGVWDRIVQILQF